MGVATEVKNMSAQWRIPPLPLPQSLYKGTVYKLFGTHTFYFLDHIVPRLE